MYSDQFCWLFKTIIGLRFLKALLIFKLFLKAYNFFYRIGINFEALLIIIFTKFVDGGDMPKLSKVIFSMFRDVMELINNNIVFTFIKFKI